MIPSGIEPAYSLLIYSQVWRLISSCTLHCVVIVCVCMRACARARARARVCVCVCACVCVCVKDTDISEAPVTSIVYSDDGYNVYNISETLVHFYQTTRRHIPEDRQRLVCENLKFNNQILSYSIVVN